MNKQNYDLVIVGCGFTGALIAHMAAKNEHKRVLILERRNHIAGNMYDEYDEKTGILVQKYGPHSFHTDKEKVYAIVQSLGDWEPFVLRARAEVKGELTQSPFNFDTIEKYFPQEKALEIKTHLVNRFAYRTKITILEMLESDDEVVHNYAQFLFEQDYRPYTAKQWGIEPEKLDVSVLKRVPVRLSYIDQYFDDRYQMQPKGGYTAFFEKLLNVSGIEICLSTDASSRISLGKNRQLLLDGEIIGGPVVYTGALDELFGCKHGKLPYRSLSFDYRTMDTADFQPTPGVAYPFAEGYTRITEFKKLMTLMPETEQTIVAYEYPEKYGTPKGQEPYYPILTEESQKLYQTYLQEAAQYKLLYPCGRLGDFKYYNMDDAILRAVEVCEQLHISVK